MNESVHDLTLAQIQEKVYLTLCAMPNKGHRKYMFSTKLEEEILPLDYLYAALYMAIVSFELEVYIAVFEDLGLVAIEITPDDETKKYYQESEHYFWIKNTKITFQWS